ncbi:hypothetical protein G7075_00085 [Phycicoccus sp. HDW14]|uniref:hypothetical protein n=1 Tax=Phycicoccus sp. HDW14 TaxID=2714941 RepID=UPI00140BFA72|nr:hypothetical protein [Phycicoccus sp. HDW14]QIM19895.1 hypothetical protein G7075_00085 [Phycicoccus sp. HDW14]
MSGADEVLDDIDAALEDYVEWNGGVDAASWSADGSHEVDTGGEYYGADIARRPWASLSSMYAAVTEQLGDEDDWHRLNAAILGASRQLQRATEERRRQLAAEVARLRAHPLFIDEAWQMEGWQLERVAQILLEHPANALHDSIVVGSGPRTRILPRNPGVFIMHSTEYAEDAGFARATLDRFTDQQPAEPSQPQLDDARRSRDRRTGREAQQSPYGPAQRAGGR